MHFEVIFFHNWRMWKIFPSNQCFDGLFFPQFSLLPLKNSAIFTLQKIHNLLKTKDFLSLESKKKSR